MLCVARGIFTGLLVFLASSAAYSEATFKLLGTITGTKPLALVESSSGRHLLGINGKLGSYHITAIKKNGIKLATNDSTRWLPLQLRTDLSPPARQSSALQDIAIPAGLLKDIARQPQKWLNAIELDPVVDEGWLAGYRIRLLRAPELVQNLGLKQNDIIRRINGVDVRQAQRFSEVVNSLASESDIYFAIERDQRPLQLHFSVLH